MNRAFSPAGEFIEQIFRETPFEWLMQAGVVVAALGIAWLVAERLCKRATFTSRWKFGEGEFHRVAFPLLALGFVWLGKLVVDRFHSPTALLQIVIALLVAFVIIRIAVYILGMVLPPGAALRLAVRAIAWLVWIGVALHVTGVLPEVLDGLDRIGFATGKDKQRITLLLILQGVMAMAVTVTIAMWLARITAGRVLAAESVEMSTRVVITKVVHGVALLAGILIALPMVGIDLTALSVFGGALGVGLGFGLQKVAANYVSGFIVLLDRSLRIGDLVTIAGFHGTVKAIESRYTLLRGADGKEYIIPNEMMITTPVSHHTYSDPRISVTIPVSVSYESDLDLVERLLLETARRQPRIIAEPAPEVRVKTLGESGIDLELTAWVGDASKGEMPLRSDLLKEILRRFREHGVEIPYPRRDLRVIATGEIAELPAASTS